MRLVLTLLTLLLCIDMIIGITGASTSSINAPKVPSFNPSDISGLQLWLKADDGILDNSDNPVSVDGTAVKTWSDQSGNNNDAIQATGANQMLWRDASNGINGLPALENAAANNLFMLGSTQLFTNSVSVFVVWKPDSITGNKTPFNAAAPYPNAFAPYVGQFYSNPRWYLGTAGMFSNQTVTVTTDPVVVTVIANTSSGNPVVPNTEYRANGVNVPLQYAFVGSLSYPTYSSSTFQVGSSNLIGKIGEILVYNTQLSSGDRDDVEAYLINKWGL
jgi:hypothetical protein